MPAILKLEYGSSAVGVKQVKTLQEARAFVQHVQNTLQSEKDHPGVGLGHSRSFVLMSRLEGTEHDVDLAMFEGQVMAAFVSDNGPTRLPVCSETTAAMPSVLNKGELQYVLYNWREGNFLSFEAVDRGIADKGNRAGELMRWSVHSDKYEILSLNSQMLPKHESHSAFCCFTVMCRERCYKKS